MSQIKQTIIGVIKKLVGWPTCHACFLAGDMVCFVMEKLDAWKLYECYNTLMSWSVDVNDWAGLEIWSKVED